MNISLTEALRRGYAQLSALARVSGPVRISSNGKPETVIVSAEYFERLQRAAGVLTEQVSTQE